MSHSNYLAAWLAGFTVCLSLIVSIGAQNLYVLQQAVRNSHACVCVAWCVVSDAVLIGIGVVGMASVMATHPEWVRYLGWGGVIFMLGYGLLALWRMAFAPQVVDKDQTQNNQRSVQAVLGSLVVITLFNPHVYLDTVLLVGSIGARQEGDLKWVFVAGAASASLVWFASLCAAGKRLRHWFSRPMTWRVLDGLTATMMLGLALWVWQGLMPTTSS